MRGGLTLQLGRGETQAPGVEEDRGGVRVQVSTPAHSSQAGPWGARWRCRTSLICGLQGVELGAGPRLRVQGLKWNKSQAAVQLDCPSKD